MLTYWAEHSDFPPEQVSVVIVVTGVIVGMTPDAETLVPL